MASQINLDESIVGPQHSIELPNGQLVVCHAIGKLHRVCIVDTSGRIIPTFGGRCGSSLGQLNWPCSLAVDEHGCVLVADFDNDRVQVLSSELAYIGHIASPLGTDKGRTLRGPYRLCLDERDGKLYIGEGNSDGRIFVVITSD